MGKLLLIKGWDYFKFTILIFASLCIELLYGVLLEPLIYGVQMQKWRPEQMIIHWTLTCISWSIALYFIEFNNKRTIFVKKCIRFYLENKKLIFSYQYF